VGLFDRWRSVLSDCDNSRLGHLARLVALMIRPVELWLKAKTK
jgi:hypothetical protein